MNVSTTLVCLLYCVSFATASSFVPVVFYHGMGDSCCKNIDGIKKLLDSHLPGIFVHSIQIGKSEKEDVRLSYLDNVNRQIEEVAIQLKSIPELSNGFNALGFSQGGLFFRAYVERFNDPPVRQLITFGSPHEGVIALPNCGEEYPKLDESKNLLASEEQPFFSVPEEILSTWCQVSKQILKSGPYWPYVRDHVVQAQYFKNPAQLDQYLKSNIFLPDVNNERKEKNSLYANRLNSLERFVLVRFEQDTVLVPRDSAWFSVFDGQKIISLNEQVSYQEDWLGLKRLNESGRLEFLSTEGNHMKFSRDWFSKVIISTYLNQTLSE